MRLLIISEVFPVGKGSFRGIYIKQQADELIKLGYDVTVLIPERNSENTSLVRADDNCYKIGYMPSRYELTIDFSLRNTSRVLTSFLGNNQFDVASIHIVGDSFLKVSIRCLKKAGVRVVTHFHGLNVWKNYYSLHRIREWFYSIRRYKWLRHCDALVGVSKCVTKEINKKKFDSPVFTVYNGVDKKMFFPENRKNKDVFRIVSVGNLIPTKGFIYLLEAFAQFKTNYSSSELVIVGDGPEKSKLQELCKALGVDGDVVFVGNVEYQNVNKYISKSDVFVLPSYYEAFGCVYLEAMACGIPVVGVETMGIAEIIKHGENGFLVPEKDSKSILIILEYLINNWDAMEKIGKNSLKTADYFSWSLSATMLDRVYKIII